MLGRGVMGNPVIPTQRIAMPKSSGSGRTKQFNTAMAPALMTICIAPAKLEAGPGHFRPDLHCARDSRRNVIAAPPLATTIAPTNDTDPPPLGTIMKHPPRMTMISTVLNGSHAMPGCRDRSRSQVPRSISGGQHAKWKPPCYRPLAPRPFSGTGKSRSLEIREKRRFR